MHTKDPITKLIITQRCSLPCFSISWFTAASKSFLVWLDFIFVLRLERSFNKITFPLIPANLSLTSFCLPLAEAIFQLLVSFQERAFVVEVIAYTIPIQEKILKQTMGKNYVQITWLISWLCSSLKTLTTKAVPS